MCERKFELFAHAVRQGETLEKKQDQVEKGRQWVHEGLLSEKREPADQSSGLGYDKIRRDGLEKSNVA